MNTNNCEIMKYYLNESIGAIYLKEDILEKSILLGRSDIVNTILDCEKFVFSNEFLAKMIKISKLKLDKDPFGRQWEIYNSLAFKFH